MTSFYTSSPTVVVPPPQQSLPDQYFHAGHYRTFQPDNTSPNGLFNQTPGSSATTPFPPTPSSGCIAGRKRSRGDIEDDLDQAPSVAPIEPSSVLKAEPTYGPGMTLSYPNDPRGHYASDAGSDERTAQTSQQSERPMMPSRKSQRTSARDTEPILLPSLPTQPTQSYGYQAFIDEVTRTLGISWMRMDRYEGGRINQRAYTRWIERHYPCLSNVELWFENDSIPGYLGTAMNNTSGVQEYLLWSFDLKQAVLVTRQPSQLTSLLNMTQPSNLIKSASVSIFANDQPTDCGNTSPGAQASVPQTSDMDMS